MPIEKFFKRTNNNFHRNNKISLKSRDQGSKNIFTSLEIANNCRKIKRSHCHLTFLRRIHIFFYIKNSSIEMST